MFSQIGPLEIVLVLVIVLVIFGPKRLPGLGKQLGTGLREFKDSVTGDKTDDDHPHVEAPPAPAPALTAATADEPNTARANEQASQALGRPRRD